MTEAEFHDWMFWFELRQDMAERARTGRPLIDPDDADDMTPRETTAHLLAFAKQFNQNRKP